MRGNGKPKIGHADQKVDPYSVRRRRQERKNQKYQFPAKPEEMKPLKPCLPFRIGRWLSDSRSKCSIRHHWDMPTGGANALGAGAQRAVLHSLAPLIDATIGLAISIRVAVTIFFQGAIIALGGSDGAGDFVADIHIFFHPALGADLNGVISTSVVVGSSGIAGVTGDGTDCNLITASKRINRKISRNGNIARDIGIDSGLSVEPSLQSTKW